jgi:hypothetical protein
MCPTGLAGIARNAIQERASEKIAFFEKSRLPLQKWVILMYMWVRQYPVTDACEEAEVGEHTAIDVYQWLWEVCSQALLNGPPIIFGGQQTVVEIDESLFRHKPRVRKNVKLSTID